MMNVILSAKFEKEAKRLIRKYQSAAGEITRLIGELKVTPNLGIPIGRQCYKIRLAIKSKGQGKSGGARVITCVVAVKETVVLLTIYDKSEKEDISEVVLKKLLDENSI